MSEKKAKGKKALKAIAAILLAAAVGCSAWNIGVRVKSDKYDLISLDTSDIPSPVAGPEIDDYVQLSEVKMHYQVYGHGKQPLILIHGNGGSINSLKEAASYLANDYTVYLPESRCHGKSSDPGEISYKLMAKDFVEFAEALEIEKPLIVGHSDGGINALTIAAEYPDFPKAIISCGANSHPSEFKPYFTVFVKICNLFHKDKLNDLMLTLPDFTEDYLAKITCPTYIVAAEYDIMWLSDSVYLHSAVKGSDLSIIKLGNHCSYMSGDGKQTYVLARNWFEKIEK